MYVPDPDGAAGGRRWQPLKESKDPDGTQSDLAMEDPDVPIHWSGTTQTQPAEQQGRGRGRRG